jgi:hypothetical protein
MGETWPKFLVDPVHRIIPFQNDECDRLLLRLINAREFQRLRRIKQLGFTELVFPGANHSRFSHSIGVMHTARMFLERMTVIGQPTLPEHKTAMFFLLHWRKLVHATGMPWGELGKALGTAVFAAGVSYSVARLVPVHGSRKVDVISLALGSLTWAVAVGLRVTRSELPEALRRRREASVPEPAADGLARELQKP